MSKIFVAGIGAVSPAGWGVPALRQAITRSNRPTFQNVPTPGQRSTANVLKVPPANPRPAYAAHPRLRRSSPIGQYAVAAALEALGPDLSEFANRSLRLGIVYCAMAGCVSYSQRFYDETLKDPATASPIIFPETVFNAPASHLGALLATSHINYTLVGDPGTFLQGIALGADWLVSDRVDACVVVGAEELDRLVVHAARLFDPEIVIGEGAGALQLRRQPAGAATIELGCVTDSHLFWTQKDRAVAARNARNQLERPAHQELLCDGLQGVGRLDADEASAWGEWSGVRLSPKKVCGEAFMASAAWQCVTAVDQLINGTAPSACVSVVGCNQQAIAARFLKNSNNPA